MPKKLKFLIIYNIIIGLSVIRESVFMPVIQLWTNSGYLINYHNLRLACGVSILVSGIYALKRLGWARKGLVLTNFILLGLDYYSCLNFSLMSMTVKGKIMCFLIHITILGFPIFFLTRKDIKRQFIKSEMNEFLKLTSIYLILLGGVLNFRFFYQIFRYAHMMSLDNMNFFYLVMSLVEIFCYLGLLIGGIRMLFKNEWARKIVVISCIGMLTLALWKIGTFIHSNHKHWSAFPMLKRSTLMLIESILLYGWVIYYITRTHVKKRFQPIGGVD